MKKPKVVLIVFFETTRASPCLTLKRTPEPQGPPMFTAGCASYLDTLRLLSRSGDLGLQTLRRRGKPERASPRRTDREL